MGAESILAGTGPAMVAGSPLYCLFVQAFKPKADQDQFFTG
jgi:hypothetical protein